MLPARDEYYRVTRARELRAKADRLEGWDYWRSSRSEQVAGLLIIAWLLPVLAVLRIGGLPEILLLLLTPPAMGWLLLYPIPLRSYTGRLRAEAERLEAEHQARYGALEARGEEAFRSDPQA